MVKKCIELYCNKQPSYNYKEDRKPLYCASHKKENMIDIITKRCIENLCNIRALFNYKDEKQVLYCSNHKKDGMINIRRKMCKENNCDKYAEFRYKEEKDLSYCFVHKKDNMIKNVYRKCKQNNCNIRPNFNYNGEKQPIYCTMHKKDGMIDIIHKTCNEINCIIRPHYNYKGQKIGIYCMKHKLDGMINITDKTCKTYLCDTQISDKYNGYCLRCYIHMFPENPIVKNYKTKERAVSEYILKTYPDKTILSDKRVIDGCSKRRPDILIDLGHQVIICEVDENQHIEYDCTCENKRIMELFLDTGSRPIIFIRFNPDDYIDKNNTKILSCWYTNKKGITVINKKRNTDWNNRLSVLKQTIDYWLEYKTDKTIVIIQLFYNQN